MKTLLVGVASNHISLDIQRMMETLSITQSDEVTICILESYEGMKIHLPEGKLSIFGLPKIKFILARSETYATALSNHCQNENIQSVCFLESTLSRGIAGKLSYSLHYDWFSNVEKVERQENNFIFYKRVMEANIIAEIVTKKPVVITIAQGKCRNNVEMKEYIVGTEEVEEISNWIVSEKIQMKDKESFLENATLLFVAGRGIGSKGNYKRLVQLAEKFGAKVGVTKALVLNGWGKSQLMLGQSGIIASPEICITFGVAGAGPFLVGIEQSKKIIAINNDTSAGIFKVAHCGIVADCEDILTALEKSSMHKEDGDAGS
ncbi:FAD-binding protein [Clostridium sp. CS001]|uniref:electron transfer flavoprotein subunit alpha/FixB family protein n=1 Tax=Clostridium sp. CS001 TaxID=2880648 RepID=UPI001CF4DCE3|nr:FAD-binding protein [Clostridium sp. CS001]MCB2289851.1 FAD-binding protein [Clostridium sp. CS001]